MPAHLAQVNVARLREPLHAPAMAEFAAALAEVNRLGEQSPGFVWRHEADAYAGTDGDPLLLFNLTVWASAEDLKQFTYRGLHGRFFARRATWFEAMEEMQFALWWIPAGARPTPEEAKRRLAHLRAHGPTAWAFTFRERFPAAEGLAAQPRD
jgi:heme-degrading monooxygenase HmoA